MHRAGEDWHVYDSRCPHQTTDIPHLALEGCTLTCPKHQWAFDIRSGKPLQRIELPAHFGLDPGFDLAHQLIGFAALTGNGASSKRQSSADPIPQRARQMQLSSSKRILHTKSRRDSVR